jgi:hypothetical protein
MMIKGLVTRIKEGVPYKVGFVLATLTLSPPTVNCVIRESKIRKAGERTSSWV